MTTESALVLVGYLERQLEAVASVLARLRAELEADSD